MLNISIDNLEPIPPVDKTSLINAITRAENIDRGLYTGSSLALMDQALADARTVNANPGAIQEEVDNATDALNISIDNLEPIPPVDKTSLINAITRAENIDRGLYTGSSLALMDQALADARIVNADPDATQPQVDNATATLNDSINNLVVKPTPPNKDSLQEAITYANSIKLDMYSQDTAIAVSNALANANAVLTNSSATQEQVDNADLALRNAINGLKSYRLSIEIRSDLDRVTGRVTVNVLAVFTNAGTVDIADLILTDNQGLSRSVGKVLAGQTKTYNLSYIMPAKFSSDIYSIIVTANAIYADGTTGSTTDSVELKVTDVPTEELEKERNPDLVQNFEDVEKAEKHNLELPATGEVTNVIGISALFLSVFALLIFRKKAKKMLECE